MYTSGILQIFNLNNFYRSTGKDFEVDTKDLNNACLEAGYRLFAYEGFIFVAQKEGWPISTGLQVEDFKIH